MIGLLKNKSQYYTEKFFLARDDVQYTRIFSIHSRINPFYSRNLRVPSHWERVAQPRATEVRSWAFSCTFFAPVALESSLYVAQWSSSRASATNFTLLSSVGCPRSSRSHVTVYAHTTTTKMIIPTRNCTTIHCELTTQSIVDFCGIFAV